MRATVRARLHSLIAAALPTVQVELGHPGNQLANETLFIGESEGTFVIPYMTAGTKTYEDDFTIPVEIMAASPSQTIAEAESRVETLFTTGVLDVLAASPSLNDLSGLLWAVLEPTRGPVSGRTDKGVMSFMRAEVRCRTRE